MVKPYIDPNERPVQGGPINPQHIGLLSAALPSPVGDVVGLLADAAGYAKDPKSLTLGSGLLSLAALAPGVPNRSAGRFLAPPDVLAKIRKAAAGDNDAYLEIRGIVDGIDSRESMERAKPYLRAIFPDYTEVDIPDYRNDFMAGIWRMVHRGDEIGRVPTSDLSKRIRAAASAQP